MQCQGRDELLALNVQSDPRVVSWFPLGCSGCRARLVGRSRACISRVSPGCGVHRRQKHGVRCAGRLARCAESGRAPVRSAEALPMCVGEVRLAVARAQSEVFAGLRCVFVSWHSERQSAAPSP